MAAEAVPHMAPLQPNGSEWPVPPVDGYTVDDFFRLDLPPHTELIDGSLVFVPSQRKFHTLAMYLLERGLRSTVPEDLRIRREMAVVINRRSVPEPDIVVVSAEADGDEELTRYEAKDVLLAVEVVSPESEDRDRDAKPRKYAGAGIQHFWRVEKDGTRPVVYVYELDPASKTYALTGIHRDQLKLTVPYPITVDLTEIDHL